ncbi:MAG: TetR family transcriptional regulator [Acidimicrobiales bacterium]|nr:TetR family transcriptional regulator [Acidimicrobiales bacterium]MDG2218323.1 TetR family transcriptional regulator [Acidimicrobiales bacterium]
MTDIANPVTGRASVEEKPKVAQILDGVLRVLARKGISGVSMRAVAREAEVAVGLMNYYFDDKQAMIAAALERIGEQDVAMVEHDDETEPEDALRVALGRVGDSDLLNVDYLGLRLQLWSLAAVDERYAEINHKAQLRYLDGLRALLSAARPDIDEATVAAKAAEILVTQNGMWLTTILIDDADLRAQALMRCERIAFG